jgi:hypothetical protein
MILETCENSVLQRSERWYRVYAYEDEHLVLSAFECYKGPMNIWMPEHGVVGFECQSTFCFNAKPFSVDSSSRIVCTSYLDSQCSLKYCSGFFFWHQNTFLSK